MRHDPAFEDATYRKIVWRLVPFLMLGYIIAYLDRSNIGFGKLETSHDLGFSDAVYGLGAGLFYLGYSAFEVPSNLLLARIGARATFARIMIVWGLLSMAFALMTSPVHFYLLRFLLGCAEAGFFPGVLLYLSYWIPGHRRARATAAFMSAMAIAGVIGGPLSGWIMVGADGAAGWQGWQWMFAIEGLPAVLMGFAALAFLANRPTDAGWLTDAEKALVAADLALETPRRTDGHAGGVLAALRTPGSLALCVMSMALIAGIGGISLWLPSILKRAGMGSVGTIGLWSALPYVFAIGAQQWVARRSDRMRERRFHAGICAAIAGLSWLALPLAQNMPWLSLALLTVTAMGSFGATGPFWSLPPAVFAGASAASGIAVITTVGGLAAFVAPIVIGWASAQSGSLVIGQLCYGLLLLCGSGLLVTSAGVKRSTAG